MEYERVLADLYSRQTRRGMKLGLERVRALLDAVGAPDKTYRSILVAGTNGKGSTCAFVDSLLRQAGKRTGFYSSPHLSRFTERIRINGAEVSSEIVVDRYEEVLRASQSVGVDPTFFELTTVMALLQFAREHIEYAVLEVGLGGRLDATNATSPVVVGIAPVDYDHMAILGNTLAEIAFEKAGILRHGVTAWIAPQQKEAADVIARVDPKAHFLDEKDAVNWPLGLRGEHQRINAALALKLVESAGITLDGREALLNTRWPGRMEWLSVDGKAFLLDGAHNPHGARALGRAVSQDEQAQSAQKWTWILAASGERDVTSLVRAHLEAGGRKPDAVVCTQPRVATGVPATRVAEMVRAAGISDVRIEPDMARAIQVEGPALIWGSLYALGHARALLLKERFDDVALSG